MKSRVVRCDTRHPKHVTCDSLVYEEFVGGLGDVRTYNARTHKLHTCGEDNKTKENTVATAVKIKESYKIVLTLSQEEAETLEVILSNIGGDPTASRRKYADNINRALAVAGVEKTTRIDVSETSDSIYFNNTKEN